MKKVDIYAGIDIEKNWEMLRKKAEEYGEVCYADFNGKEVLSTDTLDECCLKVFGKTKAEIDETRRKWREEYDRKQEEHKARIPQLTDEYRKKARGLVIESELDYWDTIVPIRLGDLYHGMELQQTLDYCAIMRDDSLTYDERLHKAYNLFMDSGHSGMSANLTAHMIARFCPDGKDLADAVINFRFGEQ